MKWYSSDAARAAGAKLIQIAACDKCCSLRKSVSCYDLWRHDRQQEERNHTQLSWIRSISLWSRDVRLNWQGMIINSMTIDQPWTRSSCSVKLCCIYPEYSAVWRSRSLMQFQASCILATGQLTLALSALFTQGSWWWWWWWSSGY